MHNIKIILDYLYKYGTMNGKSLSSKLNISLRTLQRNIKDLNYQYPNIIFSSRAGYVLNTKLYKQLFTSVYDSNETRTQSILYKIISSENTVTFDELMNTFYISESTLKKDLQNVKLLLNKRNLTLHMNSDAIFIDGEDRDKRKIIRDQIYHEMKNGFIDLDVLSSFFPEYDIAFLKQTINQVFLSFDFFVDDYFINTLLLHLIVRLRYSNEISTSPLDSLPCKTQPEKMAVKILASIYQTYGKEVSLNDVQDFSWLIASFIKNQPNTKSNEFISDTVYETTALIFREVNSLFGIKLQDPAFIDTFVLHLKNLLLRTEHHIEIKNPLLSSLKSQYPLVYEVAVYISNKIEQYYATQINENEIAYIALHVGSQIDAINSLNTKINCVLICPDFYSLKEKLYTAIHARYQESLMITNILSNADSSFDYSTCDLIITTVSLPQAFEPKAIMVNYILSQDDYIRLDQVIAKNLMHKNSLKLYNSISYLLTSEMYYVFDEVKDEKDSISFLSKQLVSRNIVPASFTEECLQREKITPTNFEALAIPHPVALTAYHSAIAVAVNKKYFNWNNKKIKMILMLAIKPDDIALFKPIFELISYYSNGMLNLDKILKADTFEDFKAQIRQIGETNEIS